MKNHQKGCLFFLIVFVVISIFSYAYLNKQFSLLHKHITNCCNWWRHNEQGNYSGNVDQTDSLKGPHPSIESGIMFLETSNKLEPSPLANCAIESAARANPGKLVYYLMKGFSGNLSAYQQPQYRAIPLLSSIKDVVILPLDLTELFSNTRLAEWYEKVDPSKEPYWIHVLSDACRIALLWKYGGIYLDTDVISLKPLDFKNFICAQSSNYANGAALGFSRNHSFTENCIVDYVENYQGGVWGHQGPDLMSRMLRKWCGTDDLDNFLDKECKGIFYLSQSSFYPIPYSDWEKYFVENTWKENNDAIESEFSKTRGVHIWNFLSGRKPAKIKNSRSLMEYFFSQYCPSTYKSLPKLMTDLSIDLY